MCTNETCESNNRSDKVIKFKSGDTVKCECCEGTGGHFANTNGKTTKIPCPNCNGNGAT